MGVTGVRMPRAVNLKCRCDARIGKRLVACSISPTGPSGGSGRAWQPVGELHNPSGKDVWLEELLICADTPGLHDGKRFCGV